MSPRRVRAGVIIVFIAGTIGMIVGSIRDNNGTAITFGIITAVAALGLLLVTAVGGNNGFDPPPVFDEAAAQALESRITVLVDAGGDEDQVRDLVRQAVRLGRAGR